MADKKSVDDVQYDDDGKPIVAEKKADDEGGKKSDSKKEDETVEDKGKEEEGKGDEKKEDEKPDFDDEAEPVIPVRKSNLQHIIARKNDKIAKLESKSGKKDEEEKQEDIEEDEDSELSDGARSAIDKEVGKRIKPIQDLLITKADEDELKDLFSTDPEAKKYEKHIKAYMGHEAYKGVSPTVIYHHLAFNQAQAVGAKKKQVADLEAKQNKGGGRSVATKESVGDLPSAEDIKEMSEEDFDKLDADVLQGKYIKK